MGESEWSGQETRKRDEKLVKNREKRESAPVKASKGCMNCDFDVQTWREHPREPPVGVAHLES